MKKLIDSFDQISLEYHQLLNSKEYRLGKKIYSLKKILKKGKIFSFFREIFQHKKLKKYVSKKPEYMNICNDPIQHKRIVVYTCITGSYDTVKEPIFVSPNCDYVLFTDNPNIVSNIWNVIQIPNDILNKYTNNTVLNRYYKLQPNHVFKDYDYAIYVDGSMQIVSDITTLVNNIDSKYGLAVHQHKDRDCIYKEYYACKILKKGNLNNLKNQLSTYKQMGFPKEYGMLECGIIVSDLHSKVAMKLFDEWWQEFLNTGSMRDQISLPYILWKNNLTIDAIGTIGNNIYNNPKVIIDRNHSK